MINKQEIFDTVSKHLLTQGRRSSDESGCLYRGPDNTKCAIGVLIKDEFLNPDDNCLPVYQMTDSLSKSLNIPEDELKSPDSLDFLKRLQNIHDAALTASWRFTLKEFAENNGLTFFEDAASIQDVKSDSCDAPRHPRAKMNKQKVFNKVTKHLLTQDEQSIGEDNTCLYRSPKGLKCAIGCLIKDKFYTKELESNPIEHSLVKKSSM
jgi:hypothetical protein